MTESWARIHGILPPHAGKTTIVQQIAKQVGAKLVVLNLSQQTDSSDLLGGFKPVQPAEAVLHLLDRFSHLVGLCLVPGSEQDQHCLFVWVTLLGGGGGGEFFDGHPCAFGVAPMRRSGARGGGATTPSSWGALSSWLRSGSGASW